MELSMYWISTSDPLLLYTDLRLSGHSSFPEIHPNPHVPLKCHYQNILIYVKVKAFSLIQPQCGVERGYLEKEKTWVTRI